MSGKNGTLFVLHITRAIVRVRKEEIVSFNYLIKRFQVFDNVFNVCGLALKIRGILHRQTTREGRITEREKKPYVKEIMKKE